MSFLSIAGYECSRLKAFNQIVCVLSLLRVLLVSRDVGWALVCLASRPPRFDTADGFIARTVPYDGKLIQLDAIHVGGSK